MYCLRTHRQMLCEVFAPLDLFWKGLHIPPHTLLLRLLSSRGVLLLLEYCGLGHSTSWYQLLS